MNDRSWDHIIQKIQLKKMFVWPDRAPWRSGPVFRRTHGTPVVTPLCSGLFYDRYTIRESVLTARASSSVLKDASVDFKFVAKYFYPSQIYCFKGTCPLERDLARIWKGYFQRLVDLRGYFGKFCSPIDVKCLSIRQSSQNPVHYTVALARKMDPLYSNRQRIYDFTSLLLRGSWSKIFCRCGLLAPKISTWMGDCTNSLSE